MKERSYNLWLNGQITIIPSWFEFRRRIDAITGSEKNVRTYQKSLRDIADTAQLWGLDPTPLILASHENIIRMIRVAKVTIEYNHPDDLLQELFWDAARMSVKDFRIRCGISRQNIIADYHELNGDGIYFMTINEELLEKIEKATKLQILFERRDTARRS